jgi:phosphoribosylcarboxyaminoimidazole (NCAIR) mutase
MMLMRSIVEMPKGIIFHCLQKRVAMNAVFLKIKVFYDGTLPC